MGQQFLMSQMRGEHANKYPIAERVYYYDERDEMASRLDLWTIQGQVDYWCKKRFPDQTTESIFEHLQEEIGELGEAIGYFNNLDGNPHDDPQQEIGDVIVLLLALAAHLNLSSAEGFSEVMRKNRKAVYEYSEEHGYHKKVKE